MIINGISGTNTQAGPFTNQAGDSYSRNLQNQIADAQKQLQELSSDKELSMEEKMKKRQEIQQQINDLNVQLRQHQMELRKEKQQAKSSGMEEMLGGSRNDKAAKGGNQGSGLSQTSMQAMLSADAVIGQARIQGSVADRLEGRAGVLKAEIKLGAALGGNTQAKEEALAGTEQKALEATASQMSTLGKAQEELERAAKTDSKNEKAEANGETKTDTAEEQPAISYTPVDVRL